MDVDKALERIAEIQSQMARAESFRAWRAITVASVGGLAFLAAAAEDLFFPDLDAAGHALFWLAVAALAASLLGADLAARARGFFGPGLRRQTLAAIAQFLPAAAAAALATLVLLRSDSAALLPGIWSILFGLGIGASRPWFPTRVLLVTWFHLLAGAVLLLAGASGAEPDPWQMGLVFGAGHLALAAVVRAEELKEEREARREP